MAIARDPLWLPLSVLIALGIGIVFVWSARSGQFDDLEGPGFKILMDDDGPDIPNSRVQKKDDSEKI